MGFAVWRGVFARVLSLGWLLGLLAVACTYDGRGAVGDGSARSDGGGAEVSPGPSRPTIVPNLDGGGGDPTDASAVADSGPSATLDARAPDVLPMDAPATMPAVDAGATPDTAAPGDMRAVMTVPAGCQIVSCSGVATRHDCCKAWYSFGSESNDRNHVQRDGLVTSFSKGADVRAAFAFDRATQDGAVGMLLARPGRVTAVRVTSQFGGAAATAPIISIEGIDGSAGCAYALGAGGQANLARALHCWGDAGFVPDRINVRIEARAPGPANIRVTALDVR